MKKLLFTTAVLFAVFSLLSTPLLGQNAFTENDKIINLGIGFGNTLHTGSGWKTSIPAISGSFEYGIKDNLFNNSSLGIGGYIGYASEKYNYPALLGEGTLKYSDIIFGARGTLHYQFVEKLDTYVGVALGYDVLSTSGDFGYYSSSASSSSLVGAFFIGGRYYFTDKIAAMSEIGYDIAVFKLGIAIKL